MELTNGGSFTAGTVANTGSMDVQVEEGSTFKVEKFVNAGEASINAAANTTYTFVDSSSTIPSVYEFQVMDAGYEMVGNDLVWKGTIKAIPEPATATLSLLALAALAARRRRR